MDRVTPLEAAFPGLVASGHAVTSRPTDVYNCIAWAAGEDDRWWWPDVMGEGYWPENAPREETVSAFQIAFETFGYFPTADEALNTDFEKLAVMAVGDRATHMCRQLETGRWTSKLGCAEDIEHDLRALAGPVYGSVTMILQRRKNG